MEGKTKQNNIMNGWLVQSVSQSDSGGTPVLLFIMTGIPPYLFTSWKKKNKISKKKTNKNKPIFFLKERPVLFYTSPVRITSAEFCRK